MPTWKQNWKLRDLVYFSLEIASNCIAWDVHDKEKQQQQKSCLYFVCNVTICIQMWSVYVNLVQWEFSFSCKCRENDNTLHTYKHTHTPSKRCYKKEHVKHSVRHIYKYVDGCVRMNNWWEWNSHSMIERRRKNLQSHATKVWK